MLHDEGSFLELDDFAWHRSITFGMDAKRPYGDGVVTGARPPLTPNEEDPNCPTHR